jgi:hypothetical protein
VEFGMAQPKQRLHDEGSSSFQHKPEVEPSIPEEEAEPGSSKPAMLSLTVWLIGFGLLCLMALGDVIAMLFR